MKKRKNGKRNVSDFQPLEYMLSPEETLKIMEKGTNVSCKLIDVLTHSGDDIVGMAAAVFGLAKATVLLKTLIERKGFDMTDVYYEVKQFFEEYSQTDSCRESLEKYGL